MFSQPVDVANATWYKRDLPSPTAFVGPFIELDVGQGDPGTAGGGPARALYANGSGTDTLLFVYTVRQGDKADPLDVYVPHTDLTRTTAMQRNGATVTRAPVTTLQSKANEHDWDNETYVRVVKLELVAAITSNEGGYT